LEDEEVNTSVRETVTGDPGLFVLPGVRIDEPLRQIEINEPSQINNVQDF
jgi:hypothetical protein